jgi:hypothetical protein
MPTVFFFKLTTADNTFSHIESSHRLVPGAEIVTRLVFAHWSRMLSMIWLKTDINRYLLHRFTAAGGFFFL